MFAPELEALTGPDSPSAHGLLVVTPDALDVTPTGRLFIRNVCMAFDRHLRDQIARTRPTFSRTV
jgi:oxygen-independent coproporphyrinogen-3 oxidase